MMKNATQDDELLWKEFEAAVDEADRRSDATRRESNLRNDPEFVFAFMKAGFAQGVFAAMKRRGLNESQLADRLGMTRQAVNQTLSMRGNITLRTIAKFSVALGLDMEDRFIEIGTNRMVRQKQDDPCPTAPTRNWEPGSTKGVSSVRVAPPGPNCRSFQATRKAIAGWNP